MANYKFKLVYQIGDSYDIKFGNNKTRLRVFAENNMKADFYTIIDLI